MTLATVLGAGAGALAGAGILELADVLATRHAARRTRPAGPGGPAHTGPAAPAPGLLRALNTLGRRLGVPLPPAEGPPGQNLTERLEAAGAPFGFGVGDVMAIKASSALIGLLVALGLLAVLPGRLGLLVILALPAAGFLAPDAWLGRRARRRGRAMELELPAALDLLRVALGAGLSVGRGLGEVGRRDRGLLAGEWGLAATQMRLGVAREEALAGLVRRCPAPGVRAFVAAVTRAERHGAPLAQTLAAQGREARAARARRLRQEAAKAAPKIQLVVALLLVPSVLLLVAAALLSSIGH